METETTNPFLKFNSPTFVENESSLQSVKDILTEQKLIKAFQDRYKKTIDAFCSEFGFLLTWEMAANIYGVSANRICIPNREFCLAIDNMDSSTICIVITGNAHIPQATDIKTNQTIDIGIEARLSESKRTKNLFCTTVALESQNLRKPFFPANDNCSW